MALTPDQIQKLKSTASQADVRKVDQSIELIQNKTTGSQSDIRAIENRITADEEEALIEEQKQPNLEDGDEIIGNKTPDGDIFDVENLYNPIKNVLDNYSTYTYNASLILLTREEYNDIVRFGEVGSYSNVLISGVGRRDETFNRNPYWNEDFYFDNLTLQSVVGLNAANKGSNVTDLSFTIIEPYGVSFLDRLMNACLNLDPEPIPNYTQAPLLLVVEFRGYDDENLDPTAIRVAERRIPIMLTKVDISFTAAGAHYQCTAVPINQLAFNQSAITLPTAVRLKAKEYTLKELFAVDDDQVNDLAAKIKEQRELAESERNRDILEGTTSEEEVAAAQKGVFKIPVISGTGLGSILTAFYSKSQATEGHEKPAYKYSFILHPEIGDTKISEKDLLDVSQTLQQKGKVEAAASGIQADKFSTEAGSEIAFQAGTSIMDVIAQLLKVSGYVTDQLDDKANASTDPYKHYKVTATLSLGEYDNDRKEYTHEITYFIVPYKMFGNRHPVMPAGKPSNSDIVKEYNYLFTGKNAEILDLKIDFNNLYFTSVTMYKERFQRANDQAALEQKAEETKTSDLESTLPTRIRFVPAASSTTTIGEARIKTMQANDVFDNIYSRQKPDMLAIDMEVVGDPAWIQEDDFTHDPITLKVGSDSRLTENGSFIVNNGQLLIKLNFKLPTDAETDTDNMQGVERSMFSGVYRVIKVESNFNKGIFKQKLDLIKLFNDIESQPVTAETIENRTEDTELTDEDKELIKKQSRFDEEEPVFEELFAEDEEPAQDIIPQSFNLG